jgi:hypothetical protein
VQATVYAIRKDFEKQKRITSKYYNKWKKCVLEMSLKKVQTSKVRLGAGEGGIEWTKLALAMRSANSIIICK